ncbi:hypothetical protein RE628_13840 [Paenibacillus sp. D2_2]|uniref:hypothetical protein n=1 Tax=Paenibacillus sp. D2_2 TaxID=3073092 RepID=UPI002814CD1A|nr:hypothetical protein [Paenibacillus sp. D2_2]WMT43229.1 hypothetical protein RE628_13840 [Paenibacillus sp. D2_2]
MKMNRRNYIAGLLAATLLTTGIISGCSAAQEGRTAPVRTTPDAGSRTSTETGGGKRELTVVKEGKLPADQGIIVQRIHRIDGANIEKWLSDDELDIQVTTLEKQATATNEPQFSYSRFRFDLGTGQRENIKEQPGVSQGKIVKSFPSPDGKYSFIQTWKNKYEAVNTITNMATGERNELLTIDNYMEVGGWLNNDSYILAAGSMENLGAIWKISVNGNREKIELQDSEVEFFTQFAVGNGQIYYTDNNSRLKRFTPTQARPTLLATDVSTLSLSPDSQRIAVTTTRSGGQEEESLLIYDTSGHVQGLQIGKGDLISYQSWSPILPSWPSRFIPRIKAA